MTSFMVATLVSIEQNRNVRGTGTPPIINFIFLIAPQSLGAGKRHGQPKTDQATRWMIFPSSIHRSLRGHISASGHLSNAIHWGISEQIASMQLDILH